MPWGVVGFDARMDGPELATWTPRERFLMAGGCVHTIYKREGWVNELEGEGELPGKYATRGAAISIGREEAIDRQTEHVIHNQDGTISLRSSYGNDPASRPG